MAESSVNEEGTPMALSSNAPEEGGGGSGGGGADVAVMGGATMGASG